MNYKGAFDQRTTQEKTRDFSLAEVKAYGFVIFEEREPVSYTVRNQNGSGSCVAQTVAKMLEVWDLKHDKSPTIYSATPTYQNRTNKPSPGMNFVDGLGYPVKNGVYSESKVPSQNMSDREMDDYKITVQPEVEKPTAYGKVPVDFYSVAQEVDDSGACMVWFKCAYDEWNRDVPTGSSDSEAVRHSVTAVDKIMYKGVEYLIIEDSWGVWNSASDVPLKSGQRAITKEFFQKHCYFAGAFTSFDFGGGSKPKWTWKVTMKYGQTSEDIKKLQEALKYEKFFPSNQECTGFFGGITARALIKWQVKHGMNDFANETDMRKVQGGLKTRTKLNELYSD